jgi:hypothetical protein
VSGEDRRDNVLLYVSGALDEAEHSEVERYLADGGPRAAGELAEAEATLAHLALSLDPLEPPERVKQALFERVANARPRLLRVRRLAPQLPKRVARGIRIALAGAAAASLVWFGVYSALTERVGGLEQTLLQQAASLSLLTAAPAAPEVKVIELDGPALRHRGFVRMIQNWQTGDCYLYAHGIRPAQSGYAYWVWFTSMEGEVVPGGRLVSDENGHASFLTQLPRNVDLGAPVVVTLEPEFQVPGAGPSGTPQLVGEYRL